MRAARQVDDDAERDAERDAVDREAGRRVCFAARLFSMSSTVGWVAPHACASLWPAARLLTEGDAQ